MTKPDRIDGQFQIISTCKLKPTENLPSLLPQQSTVCGGLLQLTEKVAGDHAKEPYKCGGSLAESLGRRRDEFWQWKTGNPGIW
ncbi:MAG: hypothetical protein AAF939_12140 [Planctomycetota bacterium]